MQFILRPTGGDAQLAATVNDADVNKAAWLPDDRLVGLSITCDQFWDDVFVVSSEERENGRGEETSDGVFTGGSR